MCDQDINDVLREFQGDYRAAIGALLHDLEVLAHNHSAEVSRGYVRGQIWQFQAVPERVK